MLQTVLFETLCGNCDHKNCCTNSAVPLVLGKDLEKIKNKNPEYVKHLKTVEISGKNVFAIKKKEGVSECIFWDESLGGCTIYDSRPMDCRLYPFDIMLVEKSYHWIVYTCNKNSDWTWSENYLKTLEQDEGFEDLMKNIGLFSEHTNMVLPTELEKTPFEILRKVNWNDDISK